MARQAAAKKIAVKRSDKFAFGVWCVMNTGRDPFGPPTRPEMSGLEAVKGLGERGVYGFEYHDDDFWPLGASAARKRTVIRQVKKIMRATGIRCTAATTNLFSHPVFKDGAFTSHDPRVRAYAVQKAMANIDAAAELGAEVYIFWGGREGTDVDIAKDPIEALKHFRDCINFLCGYVLDQGYRMVFSIEPKPNEPRSDTYLATAGHALAFIATLDHPEMVGVNPETAHIKMAGLNPLHEFAQCLEVGKLVDIHLNAQKPLRYDQDMSFGADNPKEALLVVKLLSDYGYSGTKAFDAHPYRTEAAPWDFVERCMRAYKALELKVHEVNADVRLCAMLEELHAAPGEEYDEWLACYSSKKAQRLRKAKFRPDDLAKRPLFYERIDQRLTEILLGLA
ncbi:MAG: TIM barrel protein [Phycisphaerae bacterium]|nr:TIM barrel protein [Phycisphaerae bacterium]